MSIFKKVKTLANAEIDQIFSGPEFFYSRNHLVREIRAEAAKIWFKYQRAISSYDPALLILAYKDAKEFVELYS